MNAEDKYLMGMLWKFGTIKPGTNQFVFQSYDKYEQMEYIRKRIAPDKTIKVSTRKDPRTGTEKTLYRLNFTNEEWADKVRMYEGINAEKIIDKEFARGFLETKGTVSKYGKTKRYSLSGTSDELSLISKELIKTCEVNDLKINIKSTGSGALTYSISDVSKIVSSFSTKNPKYWGDILKKMNPDD